MSKTLGELANEGSQRKELAFKWLKGHLFSSKTYDISYRVENVFQNPREERVKFDATVMSTGEKTLRNIRTGKYFCAYIEDHYEDAIIT